MWILTIGSSVDSQTFCNDACDTKISFQFTEENVEVMIVAVKANHAIIMSTDQCDDELHLHSAKGTEVHQRAC